MQKNKVYNESGSRAEWPDLFNNKIAVACPKIGHKKLLNITNDIGRLFKDK